MEANFYKILNFLIWSSISLSKAQSPKTGQNVQNEVAKMHSAVAVNI